MASVGPRGRRGSRRPTDDDGGNAFCGCISKQQRKGPHGMVNSGPGPVHGALNTPLGTQTIYIHSHFYVHTVPVRSLATPLHSAPSLQLLAVDFLKPFNSFRRRRGADARARAAYLASSAPAFRPPFPRALIILHLYLQALAFFTSF